MGDPAVRRGACRRFSQQVSGCPSPVPGDARHPDEGFEGCARAARPVASDPQRSKEAAVAIFMIERRYAEQLEPTAEIVEGVNRVNEEEGVRWLYSFLSADKRKTYCLYEAESPDAILRA